MTSNVVSLARPEAHIGAQEGSRGCPLLIPDGDYNVAFKRYAISTRYGRGSLELWFFVTDIGPAFNREVCRYFKVQREGRKSFRASPHSAYVREFAAVFGTSPPNGAQALNWFKDAIVTARVRTVTTDYRQKKLPEATRYNVIEALLGKGSQ